MELGELIERLRATGEVRTLYDGHPAVLMREAASAIEALVRERDEARAKAGKLHDYANMRDWQVFALADFSKWAIEESAFSGCDLQGADVQERAASLGLIEATIYDPIRHGPSDVAEPGMEWYEYTSLLSPAPEAATPFKSHIDALVAERDEARENEDDGLAWEALAKCKIMAAATEASLSLAVEALERAENMAATVLVIHDPGTTTIEGDQAMRRTLAFVRDAGPALEDIASTTRKALSSIRGEL